MRPCLLCKTKHHPEAAPFLCEPCHHSFSRAEAGVFTHSIYRYCPSVRSLILSAKIEGNMRALLCLSFLFSKSPGIGECLDGIERIVPAPSSLWSRIRGRTDLAWFLATSLSDRYGIPLHYPPRALYWQYQKRSKLDTRAPLLDFGECESRPPYLLVDDVVTSGHTLIRTARALEEATRFLTLASALAPGKSHFIN